MRERGCLRKSTCTTYGSLSLSRADFLLLTVAAATVAIAADCVADIFKYNPSPSVSLFVC